MMKKFRHHDPCPPLSAFLSFCVCSLCGTTSMGKKKERKGRWPKRGRRRRYHGPADDVRMIEEKGDPIPFVPPFNSDKYRVGQKKRVLGCVISSLRQQAESRNLGETFLTNSVKSGRSWTIPVPTMDNLRSARDDVPNRCLSTRRMMSDQAGY